MILKEFLNTKVGDTFSFEAINYFDKNGLLITNRRTQTPLYNLDVLDLHISRDPETGDHVATIILDYEVKNLSLADFCKEVYNNDSDIIKLIAQTVSCKTCPFARNCPGPVSSINTISANISTCENTLRQYIDLK